jgi:hypothetical protein
VISAGLQVGMRASRFAERIRPPNRHVELALSAERPPRTVIPITARSAERPPPARRHPDNSKKIRLARHGQRGFARACCAMPLSLRDAAQPQVLVVRRYARVTSDHIELTSTAP